jgi:hypothetical protein
MPAFDVARRWKGRVVLDRSGDKLGSVLDVFYDAENDEPGWVLLGVAGAGDSTRLVPVADAVEHGTSCGCRRTAPSSRRRPGWDPGGRLWPQEEAELYADYGLPYTGASLAEDDEDDEEDAAVVLRGLPQLGA